MTRTPRQGWRLVRDPDVPATDDELAAVAELLREVAALIRHLDPSKPLLTVEDLAAWLRMTPRGVRSLIERDQIPCAWLGRKRVIVRDQLLEHLAEQARKRACR
jgi:hypothetical protein